MSHRQTQQWKLDRQINLSTIIQIGTLAVLIIISWANLQRQLDLLGRDVRLLVEHQKEVSKRLENLLAASISHEVRIGTIEKNSKTVSYESD